MYQKTSSKNYYTAVIALQSYDYAAADLVRDSTARV
jgi:hypothetical protein